MASHRFHGTPIQPSDPSESKLFLVDVSALADLSSQVEEEIAKAREKLEQQDVQLKTRELVLLKPQTGTPFSEDFPDDIQPLSFFFLSDIKVRETQLRDRQRAAEQAEKRLEEERAGVARSQQQLKVRPAVSRIS